MSAWRLLGDDLSCTKPASNGLDTDLQTTRRMSHFEQRIGAIKFIIRIAEGLA
jgi:hypothetical protein